jgi:uncharacterized protein YkwD
MRKIFFLAFICTLNLAFAQDLLNDQACVSDEEYRLYILINDYRKEMGLKEIPLSASLSIVAGAHAWDLQVNQPDGGECNMHSWSDEGPWEGCCYTEDHEKADCVWAKPEEFTNYVGFGYEVAYFSSWTVEEHQDMATAALNGWKGSPGHNYMIINKYAWKRMQWNAMGVGMYGNYAVVWLGENKDPTAKAKRCP